MEMLGREPAKAQDGHQSEQQGQAQTMQDTQRGHHDRAAINTILECHEPRPA